jgi:hypothetical protein
VCFMPSAQPLKPRDLAAKDVGSNTRFLETLCATADRKIIVSKERKFTFILKA